MASVMISRLLDTYAVTKVNGGAEENGNGYAANGL